MMNIDSSRVAASRPLRGRNKIREQCCDAGGSSTGHKIPPGCVNEIYRFHEISFHGLLSS